MKKVVFYISLIILVISLSVIFIRIIPVKPFYLNDSYYLKSEIKEITIEELENLQDKKENFALFVYQPMCLVSSSFNKIIKDYSSEHQITFYSIPFNKIKETSLNKKVKYYPSLVLFKNGKVKKYLDANKNEDLEYFSNSDSFSKWFSKYIKLKNTPKRDDQETTENPQKPEENNENKNKIILKDVIREENKVNIYFFWGSGCPHCKEEFKFFSELENEYKDKYNLYTYEVWYNEENKKILKSFADELNQELKGVPFTVIGSKVFMGFGESSKEEIKESILEESTKNYDVYFDKLMNTN